VAVAQQLVGDAVADALIPLLESGQALAQRAATLTLLALFEHRASRCNGRGISWAHFRRTAECRLAALERGDVARLAALLLGTSVEIKWAGALIMSSLIRSGTAMLRCCAA
jgi:hypothetical protein